MVEKGYSFSTSRENDGVKIDITIETTKEMVMSELLGRFAELSHEVYLDMARDVCGDRHAPWDKNTVMCINPKLFECTMGVLHDLSAHFHGDRYSLTIDVEPDSVLVRRLPKG